jgi:hypothetical protein
MEMDVNLSTAGPDNKDNVCDALDGIWNTAGSWGNHRARIVG